MATLQKFRIFGVIALCLFVVSCASGALQNLQPPNVRLSNITPGTMTIFEQQYNVLLRIQNPNNAALRASGMNYRIVLNGQEFARGVSNENFTVPALGESMVSVSVVSSPLDWIGQINRLSSGTEKGLSYSMDGEVFLQGYTGRKLSFSQAGDLSPGM